MAELNVQKVRALDDRRLPIFAEFDRLADRIRMEAFNLFARRGGSAEHALDDWLAAEHEVCWPAAQLAESGDAFTLEVALAGFEPREIAVTATPREIIVKATHTAEKAATAAEVRWSEFRSNDVCRRVELQADVDVDKVAATLNNGLLKIVAPKAAAKKTPTSVKVVAKA
ncbi:MAG TPA: Hsp20/alpha crystallin family protein [Gammaproteobacteria bacterium]|nr:Hsp20/alpha crystallin family protein [Gammaproteobacteria bacterium]